jgi:CDGSH-type Zn-finger protein
MHVTHTRSNAAAKLRKNQRHRGANQSMSENEVKITVRPNGPFRVEGPVTLVDADGKQWDLTGKPAISLCRCGASINKPFCDGTHSKIGFQAAEAAVAAENKEALPTPEQ